jgi:hypothetical protein
MALRESITPNETVAMFFSCIDVLSLLVIFQSEPGVSRTKLTAWSVDNHAPAMLIKVKNSYCPGSGSQAKNND